MESLHLGFQHGERFFEKLFVARIRGCLNLLQNSAASKPESFPTGFEFFLCR